MCHDYDSWFWRSREIERKRREQSMPTEEVKKPEPVSPPAVREPAPRVEEREKVPA